MFKKFGLLSCVFSSILEVFEEQTLIDNEENGEFRLDQEDEGVEEEDRNLEESEMNEEWRNN